MYFPQANNHSYARYVLICLFVPLSARQNALRITTGELLRIFHGLARDYKFILVNRIWYLIKLKPDIDRKYSICHFHIVMSSIGYVVKSLRRNRLTCIVSCLRGFCLYFAVWVTTWQLGCHLTTCNNDRHVIYKTYLSYEIFNNCVFLVSLSLTGEKLFELVKVKYESQWRYWCDLGTYFWHNRQTVNTNKQTNTQSWWFCAMYLPVEILNLLNSSFGDSSEIGDDVFFTEEGNLINFYTSRHKSRYPIF